MLDCTISLKLKYDLGSQTIHSPGSSLSSMEYQQELLSLICIGVHLFKHIGIRNRVLQSLVQPGTLFWFLKNVNIEPFHLNMNTYIFLTEFNETTCNRYPKDVLAPVQDQSPSTKKTGVYIAD